MVDLALSLDARNVDLPPCLPAFLPVPVVPGQGDEVVVGGDVELLAAAVLCNEGKN